jgi:hypothetical protein
MKITEDVRKHAAEQGIAEEEALEKGMAERPMNSPKKAREFTPRRNFPRQFCLADISIQTLLATMRK